MALKKDDCVEAMCLRFCWKDDDDVDNIIITGRDYGRVCIPSSSTHDIRWYDHNIKFGLHCEAKRSRDLSFGFVWGPPFLFL